jgi:transcriptional regulator with XRE-family HTH domain
MSMSTAAQAYAEPDLESGSWDPISCLSPHEIGRRIGQMRMAAGFTQARLANRLQVDGGGMSAVTLSRLENGVPGSRDVSRLIQIANAVAGQGALVNTPPREIFAYLSGSSDRLEIYMSYFRQNSTAAA